MMWYSSNLSHVSCFKLLCTFNMVCCWCLTCWELLKDFEVGSKVSCVYIKLIKFSSNYGLLPFFVCFDVCTMKYFNLNLFSSAKLPPFWIPNYLDSHIAAIHLILKTIYTIPSCRNVHMSDTAFFAQRQNIHNYII